MNPIKEWFIFFYSFNDAVIVLVSDNTATALSSKANLHWGKKRDKCYCEQSHKTKFCWIRVKPFWKSFP